MARMKEERPQVTECLFGEIRCKLHEGNGTKQLHTYWRAILSELEETFNNKRRAKALADAINSECLKIEDVEQGDQGSKREKRKWSYEEQGQIIAQLMEENASLRKEMEANAKQKEDRRAQGNERRPAGGTVANARLKAWEGVRDLRGRNDHSPVTHLYEESPAQPQMPPQNRSPGTHENERPRVRFQEPGSTSNQQGGQEQYGVSNGRYVRRVTENRIRVVLPPQKDKATGKADQGKPISQNRDRWDNRGGNGQRAGETRSGRQSEEDSRGGRREGRPKIRIQTRGDRSNTGKQDDKKPHPRDKKNTPRGWCGIEFGGNSMCHPRGDCTYWHVLRANGICVYEGKTGGCKRREKKECTRSHVSEEDILNNKDYLEAKYKKEQGLNPRDAQGWPRENGHKRQRSNGGAGQPIRRDRNDSKTGWGRPTEHKYNSNKKTPRKEPEEEEEEESAPGGGKNEEVAFGNAPNEPPKNSATKGQSSSTLDAISDDDED